MVYGYIGMDQVKKETEKAYQFEVLVETFNGKFHTWNLWLPKSIVDKKPKGVSQNGSEFFEVDDFMVDTLWAGKLPRGAKEIR